VHPQISATPALDHNTSSGSFVSAGPSPGARLQQRALSLQYKQNVVSLKIHFVELFTGGGETAAVLTLDTAVESRKEMIADGVARSPDSLWSRDGNPSYLSPP